MIPKKQHIVFTNIILEFLFLNISILSVFFIKNFTLSSTSKTPFVLSELITFVLLFNVIWGLIVLINRDQEFYISNDRSKKIKSFIISTFMFIGVISTIAIIFKIEYFNRTTFLFPILLFSFLNILSFALVSDIIKRKRKTDFASNVLLIGIGKNHKHLQQITDSLGKKGYGISGFLDDTTSKPKVEGLINLGKIASLQDILKDQSIDEIFIIGGSVLDSEFKNITKIADYAGTRINIIPETLASSGITLKPYTLDGLTLYQHRQTPLDDFSNFFLKRVFDIFFSLTVIILLAPLFLILGIIISMDRKGSIFYTPLRKGESGNVFKCYKFRTMSICDNPINGTQSTVKNDPRITKIGTYLRKFDLDELPQFFNVLKGDMSVVGPRPHRVNLDKDFRKIVNDYMVRHYVKPGITGWAQVNGWRGPTNTNEQKKKRVWHDLWYIENWKFTLDIKIIFLTVFSKKTRTNAF